LKYKKVLEIYKLKNEKYPEPSNSFSVEYSWTEVWTQWTFWDTVIQELRTISNVPVDPLTNLEYTYSITNEKEEYQLAWIIEWGELVSKLWLTQETKAWDIIMTSYVTWNYNGEILERKDGTICEILSVPSIISNQAPEVTDLTIILDAKWLVYNSYKNLPSNYKTSKYKTDWWFDYTSWELVLYSDNNNCAPLFAEDATARVELITNLQKAYSGTILETQENINQTLRINIDNADEVNFASKTLVNNVLWWNVAASDFEYTNCDAWSISWITYPVTYTYSLINHNNTTTWTNSIWITEWSKDYTATISCNNWTISISDENEIISCNVWYVENAWSCIPDECSWTQPANTTINATIQLAWTNWSYNTTPWTCTFTCNANYTWNWSSCEDATFTSCTAVWQILSASTTYWSCSQVDKIVCTWNNKWYVISSCNVWTNTSWTTASSYWWTYQFWRNNTWWTNTSLNWDYVLPWWAWIDNWSANNWWVYTSNQATATYANSSPSDQTKMRWPCISWYHVPTRKEWWDVISVWWWSTTNWALTFSSHLRLPFAWTRYHENWNYYSSQWDIWRYWTSSPSTWDGRWIVMTLRANPNPYNIIPAGHTTRWDWASIRCFKN